MAALRDLHPGEAAGIDRAGVSERAIKRRLSLAAKQLGYRLKWGRQADAGVLYFRVIGTPPTKARTGDRRRSAQGPTPAPTTTRAPEATAPQARRGRRHRAAYDRGPTRGPTDGVGRGPAQTPGRGSLCAIARIVGLTRWRGASEPGYISSGQVGQRSITGGYGRVAQRAAPPAREATHEQVAGPRPGGRV